MRCPRCGEELGPAAAACRSCGLAAAPGAPPPAPFPGRPAGLPPPGKEAGRWRQLDRSWRRRELLGCLIGGPVLFFGWNAMVQLAGNWSRGGPALADLALLGLFSLLLGLPVGALIWRLGSGAFGGALISTLAMMLLRLLLAKIQGQHVGDGVLFLGPAILLGGIPGLFLGWHLRRCREM